jgi:uncharacterized membrane protein HdeD (DUF308 family)
MVRVFGGAVLVIAGIAAFIEAHHYRPFPSGYFTPGVQGAPSRLSQTGYDLLRIGGWAFVIVGALLIVVGLIAYARRDASA